MASKPCPACQGKRLKPESLAVTIGGQKHRRRHRACRSSEALEWVHDIGDDGAPRPKLTAAGADHRPPDPEGDPGPAGLPGGRRAGLPDARPRLGHPLRRRGAAHPPGHPDRQRADGRALHLRRADRRPAPRRRPPPDRDPGAAARPGQHRHRRRARRGDDAGGRLHHRHGPRGRRARRARSWPPARWTRSWTARSRSPASTSAAGEQIPLPEKRRTGNGKELVIKGARQNNLKNIDVHIPLGKFWSASPACPAAARAR